MLRQGLLEVATERQYPIGYKYEAPDALYRYTHVDPTRQLRAGYGVYPMIDYGEHGTIVNSVAAGKFQVTCEAVANVGADQFAGGRMVITSGAGYGTQYRVLSNTAAIAGNNFIVTLQSPLVVALTAATDTFVLYRNPFVEVHCMRQENMDGITTRWQYVSFNGIPLRFVPADNYCWVQTKGPCLVVLSGADVGAGIIERDAYFDTMGAVFAPDYSYPYQRAGYILPHTESGNITGAMGLIMLQLE